ncbi:hypothetical protein [Mesorhizobium sp. WSM2239]|uniref:Baseplate protein J-like domain-containing protein n=2 Tax=unclassified Mesorhizobium TaxID=325217 RepID=A0AAU8D6M2_9HYPH
MKTHFMLEVRGFNAGETDIRDRLARDPILAADPQLAYVYEAVYEAVYDNPDGLKYCAVLCIGHADRVPAGSEDNRRAEEEKAAQERADNARSWILEMVNDLAYSAGYSPQQDWPNVERAVAYQVGVGAASLATPPGTLSAGLKNRRVEIVIAGVNVDVIDTYDDQKFVLGV